MPTLYYDINRFKILYQLELIHRGRHKTKENKLSATSSGTKLRPIVTLDSDEQGSSDLNCVI